MRRRSTVVGLVSLLSLSLGMAVAAASSWNVGLNANTSATRAASLNAPTGGGASGATTSGLNLGWTAPSVPPTGYTVTRDGRAVPGGSGCAGTISGTSCTDTSLSAGTTYTYTVTAIRNNWTSPASSSFSGTTTSFVASLVFTNGSTQFRADQGDTVSIVYPAAMTPAQFCSGWSGSTDLGFKNTNVVVNVSGGGVGVRDQLTSISDPTDCSGGFHFGGIDLGTTNGQYFSGSGSIGGSAGPSNNKCDSTHNSACTNVHWDSASNTLTITFGLPSATFNTATTASVASYAADSSLGVSGTINSSNTKHF